ncbi:protein PSK SIMULATOR 1-like [Zingiber officinale]|uniref:protein PSK SIMULATOR 1-like n=1 Tax=Zingiber officinale TaxID=94328 RepID=UPI001C4D98B9|nr:protein PSK SIMULATOR 1-like [Zingiber officinale]
MGCVCSRQIRKDTGAKKGELYDDRAVEVGFRGDRKSNYKLFDSGELRVLPVKTMAGKVPESSSILGRASIAGLEKAVEVLDTLGSSMSNLNPNSGFPYGMPSRGNKISILAFEVANTIAKGANLWRSLSDENINALKEEILQSDGVRRLISEDANELLCIAALDKREELDFFLREVVRFGDLCKDPTWHNLGRYFEKLSMDMTLVEQTKKEAEATMQNLINLAQNTSELYHELHALDRYEQDYRRKLQEELIPASKQDSFLNTELKHQKKLVRSLKKKSLWSRTLEEVVEKLVDIVAFFNKKIWESFEVPGSNLLDHKEVLNGSLGASGLALHYANIINQIDNIVSRPLSLPPTIRDSLYQGLPIRVKASLRARLQSSDAKEEFTVPQVKAEMQKILRWLTPISENTIRAHQGFGWVGEWANMCTEINKKQDMQGCIIRIQTLHYANKEKTEDYILELVVWLHHLVTQVKNRGFVLKSVDSVQSQPQTKASRETVPGLSQEHNAKVDDLKFSEEERKLLEQVSQTNIQLRRSKSLDFKSNTAKRLWRRASLTMSCGNSPNKEFSAALDWRSEKLRCLDVIDGLDTLSALPIVQFYA